MNAETATYRDYLANSLARRLSRPQVRAILGKFDSLVASRAVPVQRAFAETLETYGSEDTAKAVSVVQSALEQLSTQQNKVEVNPLVRIRRHIDAFNANVTKLDITVTDFDSRGTVVELSKEAKDSVKLKDPPFLPSRRQSFNHTATANHAGKRLTLGITVSL